MTQSQWEKFFTFREEFKTLCEKWNSEYSKLLAPLQIQASKNDNVPEYPLQTCIVYNSSLDSITQDSEIKLIVIGDNPGKDEQLEKNRSYLVGQSGKIAEGFFRKNSELGIDFRKNVIILNKTPVHTAKTKELKFLCRQNESIEKLIMTSQIWMAEQTYLLQDVFQCQLWIVGYSEIKDKGIFVPWRKTLEQLYSGKYDKNYDNLFVFQHFSMNRFLIDLNMTQKLLAEKYDNKKTPTINETLSYLGRCHKLEIFNV